MSTHAAEWYQVQTVFDGDTIVLENGLTIRYLGINAPEIRHKKNKEEPFGNEARKENQNLVLHKKVRLEFDQEHQDQYGRTLAYVFLEDGRFVNRLMVEKGYAWVLYHKPNIMHADDLLKTQKAAIDQNKGIWPIWKKSEGLFFGNAQSMRFHDVKCKFSKNIRGKNKVIFHSMIDAFKNGYSPCKHCVNRYRDQ
ncbi:MAG: thermonuclease family protein [Proteobacteria bacterium]|nr:thermonuclease family protein [Pseudomonadota bacterium]